MPVSALKVQEVDVRSPSPKSLLKERSRKAAKVKKLSEAKISEVPSISQKTPEELALHYRSGARKLALSMVAKWKCRLDADDLQSVIDLAVCEAAARYNSAHGAGFMTFLYYHLKGKLVKAIAKRANDRLLFIDDYEMSRMSVRGDDETSTVRCKEWKHYASDESGSVSTEEALYQRELLDHCYKACQRLRGIEKEVITSLYFEDKELSQVTSEMGYSRGHIFRVRTRALEKLRKSLAAHA